MAVTSAVAVPVVARADPEMPARVAVAVMARAIFLIFMGFLLC
jgi:hypothetical protein